MATSQENQTEQENRAEQSESGSEGKTPPQGSGNPDHQGGKVQPAQPDADGTVAPTEEEKGGSSE